MSLPYIWRLLEITSRQQQTQPIGAHRGGAPHDFGARQPLGVSHPQAVPGAWSVSFAASAARFSAAFGAETRRSVRGRINAAGCRADRAVAAAGVTRVGEPPL